MRVEPASSLSAVLLKDSGWSVAATATLRLFLVTPSTLQTPDQISDFTTQIETTREIETTSPTVG